MAQKVINVSDAEITRKILGSFDRNLMLIESLCSVRVYNRSAQSGDGDALTIEGEAENVERAAEVIRNLRRIAELGEEPGEQTVEYISGMVNDGRGDELSVYDDGCVFVTAKGKPVKAKTSGQKRYIDMIAKNTVVLGVGPAGTGKTYLAVMMAVKALRAHEVSRIILTRPAVEAGEKLGFLPGDLQSKIYPYLRPLYDALYDMLGAENCSRLIEKMTIEIAPLAYMRGRTLDDSFIILDEAQNTTSEQMKMLLTRLGAGSKIVATGDLTQTDLPRGQRSGLAGAVKILRGIDGIGIHEFSERDVVRHRLVQKIIVAYDKQARSEALRRDSRSAGSYKLSAVKKNRQPK